MTDSMDQREDSLGTCAGFCECYKVPHRKGLCNAPWTWRRDAEKEPKRDVWAKRPMTDAERWLAAKNLHVHGDFRATLANGVLFDLRDVLAEFADIYFRELQDRTEAYKKIAEEALDLKPPKPIVVPIHSCSTEEK